MDMADSYFFDYFLDKFSCLEFLRIMPGEGQSFERHASVTQQRRLALQYKRNAWLGPPSDV